MQRIGQGIRLSERETVVRIAQDEDKWTIHTSIPAHSRKLDKIAEITEDYGYAREYTLHKSGVSFRRKRVASQNQKNNLINVRKRIKSMV